MNPLNPNKASDERYLSMISKVYECENSQSKRQLSQLIKMQNQRIFTRWFESLYSIYKI